MSRSAGQARATWARPTPGAQVDLAVVTGIHRSGTTFLANVLASASGTHLLGREPLNRRWGVAGADTWYPVLTEAGSQGGTTHGVTRPLLRLRRGRLVRWQHPSGGIRPLRATLEQNSVVVRARLAHQVLVLKDPFLSVSLPFAHAHLTDRPIVVSMRHPCAWTMSLERVDWHPGWLVNQLQTRPEFAHVVDRLDVPRRDWVGQPLAEASAWAWTILTKTQREQISALPEGGVISVPLESMRETPLDVALDLVERVGLSPDQHTVERITELTEGSEVAPQTTRQHVLKRDTRASVDAWRTRMDPADQRLVWSICEPVSSEFYSL